MVKLNHHYTKLSSNIFFQQIPHKTAKLEKKNQASSFDEISITNNAKNELANIQELFAVENRIALSNPTRSVYIDPNVMAGRTHLPLKQGGYGGVVYLSCSDRTYQAYTRSPDCPKSIYEIEGADEIAIEFRSLSKTPRFSPLRRSYTVIPHALKVPHSRWKQRSVSKSNNVSDQTQEAAQALYSEQGSLETNKQIETPLQDASTLRKVFEQKNCKVFGGNDAPYWWIQAPQKLTSWEFFELLVQETQIITILRKEFGTEGNRYLYLCTFGHLDQLQEGALQLSRL